MIYRPKILVCDDDPSLLRSLALSLRDQNEVQTAGQVSQAIKLADRTRFDIAIIDLNFTGQELDGVYLLDYFNRQSTGTFLIILSGDAEKKAVIEAMRRRHFRFIEKEKDFASEIHHAVRTIRELIIARENESHFQTQSESVQNLLDTVEQICIRKSDAAILILGETGVGKEFLVKHIAKRQKKPLISVNMSTIHKETAESVLFGNEAGAFTGALKNRIGYFEAAHNGFLFMDEIGDCSLEIQAKLLRVLQEGQINKLGNPKPIQINVRFIAATHKDLKAMVQAGLFREDLYQRLSTFILRLPALKDRPDDVMFYANLFLKDRGFDGGQFFISKSGEDALKKHSWIGNVRELKNVCERIAVLSHKLEVDEQVVAHAIKMGDDRGFDAHSSHSIDHFDPKLQKLIHSLEKNGGNKRLAARDMGVNESTIYRMIMKFNLCERFGIRRVKLISKT